MTATCLKCKEVIVGLRPLDHLSAEGELVEWALFGQAVGQHVRSRHPQESERIAMVGGEVAGWAALQMFESSDTRFAKWLAKGRRGILKLLGMEVGENVDNATPVPPS